MKWVVRHHKALKEMEERMMKEQLAVGIDANVSRVGSRNMDAFYANKQWDELKGKGSSHYKVDSGGVEPIDLFRSAKPHESYNAFDTKALTDVIKYAFRLLTRGYLASDVEKILHYMELYRADMEGR
jgi:hypothetical protein